MVTVSDREGEQQMTASEAYIAKLEVEGFAGDTSSMRQWFSLREELLPEGTHVGDLDRVIELGVVTPGSVVPALEPLRMATRLDAYGPGARLMIEPWLVERALARLGDRRLSREEQKTVVKATRTPGKVRWPEWWTVRR